MAEKTTKSLFEQCHTKTSGRYLCCAFSRAVFQDHVQTSMNDVSYACACVGESNLAATSKLKILYKR